MRLRTLLLLGFLLWLAMTALIGVAFVSRAVLYAEQVFNQQSQQISDLIGQRVLANEAVLDAYAAYTLADGGGPTERRFTRQMMRRYPQIVAMERIERVHAGERARVERELMAEHGPRAGLFGFDYRQRRVVSPLPARNEYFPVLFVEPMTLDGTRVIGLDIGYVDFQRETVLASAAAGRSVSSRPYPLIEGQMGYLLVRPADERTESPHRFVGMVVNSEVFAPQLSDLPDGMRVRMWHKRYGEAARDGRFFDRSREARGRLEAMLFPRLEQTRQIGSDSQPFLLRVSWQLGWSQLGAFEWTLMAVLSLVLLLLLWVGMHGAVRGHERRREREAKLFQQANYDTLTGLANRHLFYDRLQHAMSVQSRSGRRLAVLFLDLNRFKPVNDTYGHAAGDAVLKVLARRLAEAVRDQDTVARLGGDEFVVLLEAVEARGEVEALIARLKAVVGQPIVVDGRSLEVGVSVGVAYYPDDGVRIDELLAAADRKMYGSKSEATPR